MDETPLKIQIDSLGADKPSPKEIFENLLKDFEWTLKLNGLIAKMRKSAYDAYLEEGFSKEQALSLIK